MNNNKNINSLRFLAVDMVSNANSGHPGICLGAASTIYKTFEKMNFNPGDDRWINRDRFVMAAGHGSALLYSTLFHYGFDLTLSDLKAFRKVASKTPGHPEFGETAGVDCSAGPLGQGIPQAVGMAIAEKFLANKFNKSDLSIVDHYTYVLTCDGDLQSGPAYEAMSLAGHLKLNKLILLYDSNDIQLDGPVSDAFSEDIEKRCESVNFNYILVEDGDDLEAINQAIENAQKSDRPTLIELKTVLGLGTSKAGTADYHGAPISPEDRDFAAKHFNYHLKPFEVDQEAKKHFEDLANDKKKSYQEWNQKLDTYKTKYPSEYKEFKQAVEGEYKIDLTKDFDPKLGESAATRNASPEIIQQISKYVPTFIGGSADLKKSTKVYGVDGNFPNGIGRNINFGVREHAMCGMVNGMMLHGGVKAVGSGFFCFTDYTKPAMRMAALQHIPCLFVFTHDSVWAGEDGPTHQPIEHLTALRATPNLNVVRPADFWETVLAYNAYLKETTRPTLIVLTRQNVTNVSSVSQSDFDKGAYVIKKEEINNPLLTVVATGSEVSLVLEACQDIKGVRVVSMPSMNNFNVQSDSYKKTIIPDYENTLFIEASDASSGYRYAKYVYGINHYGYSGPGVDVAKKCNFSLQDIKKKIKELV